MVGKAGMDVTELNSVAGSARCMLYWFCVRIITHLDMDPDSQECEIACS